MTGPPPGDPLNGRVTVAELWRLIRDDLHAVEERIASQIADSRSDFRRWVEGHEHRHATNHAEHAASVAELSRRVRDRELIEARRAGILGVVRWGIELAGRNWQLLVGMALAAAIALSGVRISF